MIKHILKKVLPKKSMRFYKWKNEGNQRKLMFYFDMGIRKFKNSRQNKIIMGMMN